MCMRLGVVMRMEGAGREMGCERSLMTFYDFL